MRDGLGTAAPGNVGNSQLLNDMIEALDMPQTAATGGFSNAARSAAGLAADLLNTVASGREQMETRLSFDTAQNDSLRQMELSYGVDTDAEMQKLMMIEQAFAANAQVITTADEMMQLILGL